ncbi:histidinol-phosphate transaminase [Stenoxybacter acetivorans]|uniref:histidinol-phosphate transaminase n=1 Tax=Stenoxybacter acetivorans TaxID=422441 RepID=UPI00056BD986|nr:histidinol-phosphate transaminase [Stenoxybacter acetivorans]
MTNSKIQVIRPDIRAMSAYRVAEVPPDFIKLDAMESPYDYPNELKAQLGQILADVPVRLYPHVSHCDLLPLLHQTQGIPETAAVALGNGSDELIEKLTLLVAKPDAKVLAATPSFVMYRVNAELFGMEFVGVPLRDDFTMNLDAMLAAVETHQPALVFIAYPNNPTGGRFAREKVEAIIQAASGLVVVDEAYGAFSSDTFLPQAGAVENLIVLRTMSKIGFAGLRIGYACGAAAVIDELKKIIAPYNMNQLSLAAAAFALNYTPFIAENISKLKAERERMRTALRSYPCVRDFASEANFLTIRVPDAQILFDCLYHHKILIKNLHGTHPLLNQCVRITIGLPEQNQAVLRVIDELYGKQ